MDTSKIGCVPLIIIAVVILLIIGYMQKVSDGYFLGVAFIAVMAFLLGKDMKK